MALYPPIVASSMPPFVGSKAKIYFNLSNYNNQNNIQCVHVSIRRQDSNVSIINNGNQITVVPMQYEQETNRYYVELDSDSVDIQNFDIDVLYKVQLRFSAVSANNYTVTIDGRKVILADYFTEQISLFSEWSTVCIIKRIQKPLFYISEFTTEEEKIDSSLNLGFESSENSYHQTIADFNIVYEQNYTDNGTDLYCSEILRSWRVKLFKEDGTTLLADSGININTANNYNIIQNQHRGVIIYCGLPYEFSAEQNYVLKLEIETKNGYVDSKEYNFKVQLESYEALNGIMVAAVNEEEGYIKITATIHENEYNGNLVIRRSDSKGDFLNWTDIKYLITDGQPEEIITYYDFTVQSGTFYKYLIQKIDIRGRRGTAVYATYLPSQSDQDHREKIPGAMGEWEHAFLLETSAGNGELDDIKQLKLKFDFQINSYKYNILESKTDTLGSKYPFIKRNGDMYYRSFGCSGTISGFMDDCELFITDEDLYNDHDDNGMIELYTVFKGEIHNYTKQYDYIRERKFREKVEEFLYNAKPKLYKSTQEGNMIIKLMDVSLTPKNELGRLIYTFSATAYEIESASLNGLKQYGFITPGTYDPSLVKTYETIGNLTCYINKTSYQDEENPYLSTFPAGYDLIGHGSLPTAANSIANKISYQKSFNGRIVDNFTVKWLRVTVEDQSYIIVKTGDTYAPYEYDASGNLISYGVNSAGQEVILKTIQKVNKDSSTHTGNDDLYLFKEFPTENEYYIGTLAFINGTPIIIAPPNNIYEITDVPVDSFVFAKPTTATIDYLVEYSSRIDSKKIPIQKRTARVNGQFMGTYLNSDIASYIRYKYNFTYQKDNIKVKKFSKGIKRILIDTEPGTEIVVKVTTDPIIVGQLQEVPFIVNHTGELDLDFTKGDEWVYIKSYVIKGKPVENGYQPVDALVFYYTTVEGEYY